MRCRIVFSSLFLKVKLTMRRLVHLIIVITASFLMLNTFVKSSEQADKADVLLIGRAPQSTGMFVSSAPAWLFAVAAETPVPLDCADDPSAPLPLPSLSATVMGRGPRAVLSEGCRYNGKVHLTANDEETEQLNITFVRAIFVDTLTVSSIKLGNGSSMTFLSCQSVGVVTISPTLTTASSLFLFQNFTRRVEEDLGEQFQIIISGLSLLNSSRFIVRDSKLIAGALNPIQFSSMTMRGGSTLSFTNVNVLHGGHDTYSLFVGRFVEITGDGTRFVIENSTFESSFGISLQPKSTEGSEIVVLSSVFRLKRDYLADATTTGFVASNVKTLIFDQNSRIIGGRFSMSQSNPGKVRNCHIVLRESHLSRVEFLDKRTEIPLPNAVDYDGDPEAMNTNNTLIITPSTNISVSLLVSAGIETSFGLFVGGDGDGIAATSMVIPLIQLSARWCARCSFLVSNVISTNTTSAVPAQDMNKFGLRIEKSQFWNSTVTLAGYTSNLGYIAFTSDVTFSSSNVTLFLIQTSQQIDFQGSFSTSSFILSNSTIADTITFHQRLVNAKVTIRDCLLIAPSANSVRFSNPIQGSSVSFLGNELHSKTDLYSNHLILFPQDVGRSLLIFRKNMFLSMLGGGFDLMRLSVDSGVLIFAADNAGSKGLSLELSVVPPTSDEVVPTTYDEPNACTQIHFHNVPEMKSVSIRVADAKNLSISFVNTSVLIDFTMTLANIASSSVTFLNFTSEAASGMSISASSFTDSTFVMRNVRTLAELLVDVGDLSRTNVTIADAHVRNAQFIVNAVETGHIELFRVISGTFPSISIGVFEIRSRATGLAFINSTLRVSQCVCDTIASIALAVRLSLGKGSQHIFTDNILTSEHTFGASALFYDRNMAVLGRGDIIMLNNTLRASTKKQTESSGALVLRSNGSNILFDSSNRITSGILRVELFNPPDERTPQGKLIVEIFESVVEALVVVVDFSAPSIANSVRFSISDSSFGLGSSFGEGQPSGASFTLSVQDGSPVLGFDVTIRNTIFEAGLFFETAGVLCYDCQWKVQNVSVWMVSVNSGSFSSSTLVFESMQIQRQFLFQCGDMLMNSQLLLKELHFIAEAVDEPLKIGPPSGAPQTRRLVLHTSAVLEISSCRAASALSGSVTSIIALFKRGSRATITGNSFSSLWTGTPLTGVGALVFPPSNGSFESGSQLAVVNNTLAVSQEGYYILFLITAGGSFIYDKDNKCATVGRFAVYSHDAAPSSAFNIAIHHHERLSYIDISTIHALVSKDDMADASHSTCISILSSSLTGGIAIDVGPWPRSSRILVSESEASAMSVSVDQNAFSTPRVEISRLVVRRRMHVSHTFSGANATNMTAPSGSGGIFLISECELESLGIVTASKNITFMITNSTIKGDMFLSGSLADSSLTIARCQWPMRATANRLVVRSLSTVRTTILVSSVWMASLTAPLVTWSLAADTGTFIWFDNNKFHSQLSSSYPYCVFLDLAGDIQVTSQLKSLARFTRNLFAAGNALPSEGTISLQVFLQCSRIEHDETNVYEGSGGLSIVHQVRTANNTVVFAGAKNSSFAYTGPDLSTNDVIRVEDCTIYNILSVYLGGAASQARLSIINIKSAGIRINAGVVSHSRILVSHLTTKGPINLFESAQARHNFSFAMRNSTTNSPIVLSLFAECSDDPDQRCLLIFENNIILARTEIQPDMGSALSISGTLSDGVHLEISNNKLVSSVYSTVPTLHIRDGALSGGANLTINGNTISTAGTVSSFELRPSKLGGRIEIWGNRASSSMAFFIGGTVWSFTFIGNEASSFAPDLDLVDVGLPSGYRKAACNLRTSDNSFYEIPMGGVANEFCSKFESVSRCPSLQLADFEQVLPVNTPVSAITSCEVRRPSSAGLLDFNASRVVPTFGLFLSCASCAVFSNASYWDAFARVIWPTVSVGTLSGVPLSLCEGTERHSSTRTADVPHSRTSTWSVHHRVKSATESAQNVTNSASVTCSMMGTPRPIRTLSASSSPSLSSSSLQSLSSPISRTPFTTNSMTETTTATNASTESQMATQSSASRTLTASTSLSHTTPPTASDDSIFSSRSLASGTADRRQLPLTDSDPIGVTASASLTPSNSQTQAKRLLAPLPVGTVAEALVGTVAAAGVVTSITAFVSVSGGQLGVANAMARLTSCDEDAESNNVEGGVPALVHPLRFSVFRQKQKSADGAYIAAALSNTVLIPAIVALLARFPAFYLVKVIKGIKSDDEALVCIGWPAVVMMPFVTLAEGIGVSVVRALLSREAVGIVFGLIGALSTALFTAWWLRVLLVFIKRTHVTLVEVDPSDATGFRAMGLLMRCITPWYAWAPKETDGLSLSADRSSQHLTGACAACTALRDNSAPLLLPPSREEEEAEGGNVFNATETEMSALSVASHTQLSPTNDHDGGIEGEERRVRDSERESGESISDPRSLGVTSARSKYVRAKEEQLERYGNAVGDKRLFYAEILSFALSLLVGVCEGVPAVYCRPRALIAAVAAILQCACNCLSFVPIGLLLEALMSVFVVPMSVLVVVEVFSSSSLSAGDVSLVPVIEVLSLAANIVGLAIVAVGLLLAVRELTTTTTDRRSNTKGDKSMREERANAVNPSAGRDRTSAHVEDSYSYSQNWSSELIESPPNILCPPATDVADQRQFQQEEGGDAIANVIRAAPVLAVETEVQNLSGSLFVGSVLPILSTVPEVHVGRLRQSASAIGSAEYFSSSSMGMGGWNEVEQSEEDRVRLLVLECFGAKRR